MMKKQRKYTKSAQAFTQAYKYMPGGVNSPVRAFGGVDNDPVFIASAKGAKVYDLDGNEYIDYVGSWGPMILGHAHHNVIKAVKKAAEKSTSFGAPTLAETELAKKITANFKSIEKLRLVNSGTEAVMTAIRLARGYTKKDLIIKMIGCYHGHSDSLLVSAGSGLAENSTPSSSGVPVDVAKLTIALPYNDIEAVKTAFLNHKSRIAAIIVEPVAANMGVVLPQKGYLEQLRQICKQEKSLLIFDEVITGFRLSAGGAQKLFDIIPDLTCLGKIAGGGLPLAAFGGKTEIMNQLAPLGSIYQAGTLSGNPIATAAANATLNTLLDDKNYQKLEESGAFLESGLKNAAKQSDIPLTINRIGSIMSCFFTDKPVNNFDDVQTTNIKMFKKFFAEMLNQGIYLAPSAYEAMFISLAHTKKDLEETIKAAKISFAKCK
ncbi:MAG TPA: glutamate-1-semialdehyde 2,1-aminomutase [Sedimentisphaerales bacterium]|nr:glutamate-1-semialdehyde 2,1-aminomutase [Sedimentisphaerales bacterium]